MDKLKKAVKVIVTVLVIASLVMGVISLVQSKGIKIPSIGNEGEKEASASTITVFPGDEKTITIKPGIKTPWIHCRGAWSFDSNSSIEVEFKDGYKATYHPGDKIDFGSRTVFSIRNLSETSDVIVTLSVN